MKKLFLTRLLCFCLAATSLFYPGEGITAKAQQTASVTPKTAASNSDWSHYAPDKDGTATLASYTGTATDIVIPSELDGIVISALYKDLFRTTKNIVVKVTFPNTVKEVPGVLAGSTSLTSVTIPEGVEKIGAGAFQNCTSLREVNLPSTVTEIDAQAFLGCTSLETFTVPKEISTLGIRVFSQCENLTDVFVEEGNPSYTSVDGVVYSKDLSRLVCYPAKKTYNGISDSVTCIGGGAFEGCPFESIILSDHITTIEKSAFAYCKNLSSIHLPDHLESIGSMAFGACENLTEISFPDSATDIGSGMFWKCTSLAHVTLPKTLEVIQDTTFQLCESLSEIVLPESLKKIGQTVFYGCSSLRAIRIPDSVTEIGLDSFAGCSSLSGVDLPKNLKSMGNCVFYNDSSLYNLIIPEGTLSLGNAILPDNIDFVIIPSSVTDFGTGRNGFWGTRTTGNYCCYAGSPAEQFAIDNDIPYELIGETYHVHEDFIYTINDDNTVEIVAHAGANSKLVIPGEIEGRKVTGIFSERRIRTNNHVTSVTIPNGITSLEKQFLVYENLSEIILPASITSLDPEVFVDREEYEMTPITIKSPAGCYAEIFAKDHGIAWEEYIPDNPDQPTDPDNPDQPTNPDNPDQPTDPDNPDQPTDPDNPDQPTDPDNPDQPTDPDNPDQPTDPDNPDQPTDPDNPDQPTVPDNPDQPTVPDSPDQPTDPNNPDQPVTPINPDDKNPPQEHIHSYQASVTKNPTCSAPGIRTFTCLCKKQYTEAIPTLGHQYTEKITSATTKKDGTVQQICSVCSNTIQKAVIYRPKKIALNQTDFTFNGKAKKPSVTVKDQTGKRLTAGIDYKVTYPAGRKNPGKYSVSIQFLGKYSGKATKTFTIRPKATKLKKVTAASHGFLLSWKKQTAQTDGYQIQYCTGGEFKGNAVKTILIKKNTSTKKNFSGLKAKKKYYVRIRTFKTVKINGKNKKLYSDWSNTKTVRTKS